MFVGMNFSRISTLVLYSILQLFNHAILKSSQTLQIKYLMKLSGFTVACNGKMNHLQQFSFGVKYLRNMDP